MDNPNLNFNLNNKHIMENRMSYDQKSRFLKIYQEKFYLLNVQRYPNNFKIDISGSSKNIYSIFIYDNTKKIKCNCPDMKSWASYKRCICKHCCFLLFKVLKVDNLGDFFNTLIFPNDIYQEIIVKLFVLKNSLDNENVTIDSDIMNKDMLKKYNEIMERNEENDDETKKNKYSCKNNSNVINKDLCPICFVDFGEKDVLLDCPSCKKTVHKSCMEKWLSLGKIQCVYCRSDVWKDYYDDDVNKYKNLDD